MYTRHRRAVVSRHYWNGHEGSSRERMELTENLLSRWSRPRGALYLRAREDWRYRKSGGPATVASPDYNVDAPTGRSWHLLNPTRPNLGGTLPDWLPVISAASKHSSMILQLAHSLCFQQRSRVKFTHSLRPFRGLAKMTGFLSYPSVDRQHHWRITASNVRIQRPSW